MSIFEDTSFEGASLPVRSAPFPQEPGTDDEPGREFEIVKFVDKDGLVKYRVYNPETGKFQSFTSEAEVWRWLD